MRALFLAILLAGCVTPSPTRLSALAVYVENDVHPHAVFEIRVTGLAPILAELDRSGTAPNVQRAFNGTFEGQRLVVDATETTTGSKRHLEAAAHPKNYLVVELYSNHTIDAWVLDHEPRFE
jgi:hypothetical protein